MNEDVIRELIDNYIEETVVSLIPESSLFERYEDDIVSINLDEDNYDDDYDSESDDDVHGGKFYNYDSDEEITEVQNDTDSDSEEGTVINMYESGDEININDIDVPVHVPEERDVYIDSQSDDEDNGNVTMESKMDNMEDLSDLDNLPEPHSDSDDDLHEVNGGADDDRDLKQYEHVYDPEDNPVQDDAPEDNPSDDHVQENEDDDNPVQDDEPEDNPSDDHVQDDVPEDNPSDDHVQDDVPEDNPSDDHVPEDNPSDDHVPVDVPEDNPSDDHVPETDDDPVPVDEVESIHLPDPFDIKTNVSSLVSELDNVHDFKYESLHDDRYDDVDQLTTENDEYESIGDLDEPEYLDDNETVQEDHDETVQEGGNETVQEGGHFNEDDNRIDQEGGDDHEEGEKERDSDLESYYSYYSDDEDDYRNIKRVGRMLNQMLAGEAPVLSPDSPEDMADFQVYLEFLQFKQFKQAREQMISDNVYGTTPMFEDPDQDSVNEWEDPQYTGGDSYEKLIENIGGTSEPDFDDESVTIIMDDTDSESEQEQEQETDDSDDDFPEIAIVNRSHRK